MNSINGLYALVPGAWDITTFLDNAQAQLKIWGGGLLVLLGVAGLIWGGALAIKKLMSNGPQQGGANWGQIILLILVGGGFAAGGWSLINTIGSGGQTSLLELGGGTALLNADALYPTLSMLGLG